MSTNNDYNFTIQLQLYAADHIKQKWLDELENDDGEKGIKN